MTCSIPMTRASGTWSAHRPAAGSSRLPSRLATTRSGVDVGAISDFVAVSAGTALGSCCGRCGSRDRVDGAAAQGQVALHYVDVGAV